MKLLHEIWLTYLDMAPYLVLGLLFAGVLHIFFKKSFIEKHLGKPGFMSIMKASILGVPLPLCSCGVVPTALSLKEHKASNGAVVSFLISTPQTGVDSIAATYGMMGPFFAIFRPLAAFVMGIFGGVLTAIFGADKVESPAVAVEADCADGSCALPEAPAEKLPFGKKIVSVFTYGLGEFLDGIASYIAVGIIISGLITYFLPEDFFSQHIGNQWGEMALMVLGGVPLYICSTGSIPIALSLMMKGLSPGAAFVFLAVGPATNAATITVIKSKLGTKVTILYLVSMILSALFAGWLLNSMGWGEVVSSSIMEHAHHHDETSWVDTFSLIVSILFLLPLGFSLYKNHLATPLMKLRKGSVKSDVVTSVPVEGMTCKNCARHVTQAALAVTGVTNAEVDLDKKLVKLSGEFDKAELIQKIEKEGYHVPSSEV